jgi:type IV pilus assembly protein PilV
VSTERTARADAGFTLIEVLIALVILAVGLLALEAMGIGAARMVARAQNQSEYAAAASDTLEKTLNRIRAGSGAVGTSSYTLSDGAGVALNVARTDLDNASTALDLWSVTVTVTPPSGGALRPSDGVTLRSNVLR